eukprot:3919464-Alexandrium_andersonii.AAC.1
MSASLVGSEMCIRDSLKVGARQGPFQRRPEEWPLFGGSWHDRCGQLCVCLLYTSDAADDM